MSKERNHKNWHTQQILDSHAVITYRELCQNQEHREEGEVPLQAEVVRRSSTNLSTETVNSSWVFN